MAGRRVLILGGTNEAVDLAAHLDKIAGLDIISSLAGVTTNPRLPEGEIRRGGYGGAEGLAYYLRDQTIHAVIDATHPHAARISRHAAQAGEATGVPVLHLVRPPWEPVSGDIWHVVENAGAAADWLERSPLPNGTRVLLAIGRSDLRAFTRISRLKLVARCIEAPEDDIASRMDRIFLERGPFALASERRLLVENEIACLVAKNSGGGSSFPKIQAAREHGLPVVMIEPPPPPEGLRAHTVAEAVAWVEDRLV